MDSHGSLGEESVWESDTAGFEVFDASGADTGGFEVPEGSSVFIDSILDKAEDVLHDDDVTFHSDDFGDVGDFARAALESTGLDDEVYCGGDLFADSEHWEIEAAHVDKCFDT